MYTFIYKTILLLKKETFFFRYKIRLKYEPKSNIYTKNSGVNFIYITFKYLLCIIIIQKTSKL